MAYSKEYIDNAFNEICEQVAKGESLRKILLSENSPVSMKFFFKIVGEDEDKRKQYTRAMDIRTELKFESIMQDYTEEPQRDPLTGKIDPSWVNLQRLKIDAKKWELSKLMPKKYGEKLDVDHTTKGESINVINLGAGVKPTEE